MTPSTRNLFLALALSLAAITGAAQAQDTMGKSGDGMKSDGMKKNSMGKSGDAMKADATKKDTMGKSDEAMKSDAMTKKK